MHLAGSFGGRLRGKRLAHQGMLAQVSGGLTEIVNYFTTQKVKDRKGVDLKRFFLALSRWQVKC